METPLQGNPILRYLAIVKAARDFGLSHEEIAAVAGRFQRSGVRPQQLADALADLIVARGALRDVPTA